mgnify:CR=1 FL=1
MKQSELFIREIAARITGDDDKALAAKTARQAHTAIESQLAALLAEKLDNEDSVEQAETSFQETVYPKGGISDRKRYVARVADAHNTLEAAREELEDTLATIALFTNIRDGKLDVLKTVKLSVSK